MDSLVIAKYLEKEYPSPSLHVESPLLQKVIAAFRPAANTTIDAVIAKVPRLLLNPRSQEYFYRTRAVEYGMPLPQWEVEKGGLKAWEEAKEDILKLAKLLNEEKGPYFMGETRGLFVFKIMKAVNTDLAQLHTPTFTLLALCIG